MYRDLLQEHLSLIKNNIEALGKDIQNLPALRTINCRHNKLTDKGIPKKVFKLQDLSVVVSLSCLLLCILYSVSHGHPTI